MTELMPIIIRGKTFTPDSGSHDPNGKACVMEMAAYMAGEPWSDSPKCASPVIGAFARSFWDASPDNWAGLVERLEPITASANREADDARAWLATDWLVRTFTPVWLRKAGLDEEAAALIALPPLTSSALAKSAQPIIDEAKRKAAAAGAAAGAAAWDAAGAAARDAARAAARAAAGDAARAAARAAARDAAGAAAGAAARDAAAKKRTYSTKYDAAYKAARSVLDVALAETVNELRNSAFDLLDRMLLQGEAVAA